MVGFDCFIRSITLALSGSRIWRKPSRLAWIQRGRSTTNTGAVPLPACNPVTSRTYLSARFA